MTGLAGADSSWQWTRLADLRHRELLAILRLRQQVFVVEQRCAYLDLDGLDEQAWHLSGWQHAGDAAMLVAYLRLLSPGRRFAEPSIGRVVVAPVLRGRGLGRRLMREGLARSRSLWPGKGVRISAQAYLRDFYTSLGFAACSSPYDEDGIAHVDMLRAPDPTD